MKFNMHMKKISILQHKYSSVKAPTLLLWICSVSMLLLIFLEKISFLIFSVFSLGGVALLKKSHGLTIAVAVVFILLNLASNVAASFGLLNGLQNTFSMVLCALGIKDGKKTGSSYPGDPIMDRELFLLSPDYILPPEKVAEDCHSSSLREDHDSLDFNMGKKELEDKPLLDIIHDSMNSWRNVPTLARMDPEDYKDKVADGEYSVCNYTPPDLYEYCINMVYYELVEEGKCPDPSDAMFDGVKIHPDPKKRYRMKDEMGRYILSLYKSMMNEKSRVSYKQWHKYCTEHNDRLKCMAYGMEYDEDTVKELKAVNFL
ncbi:hypothetical protein NECID01_1356 [Nematocida sp. AWRm77]|nr:hypothetical protein NECID01_1356 [Nematocida sp. AWRm77]